MELKSSFVTPVNGGFTRTPSPQPPPLANDDGNQSHKAHVQDVSISQTRGLRQLQKSNHHNDSDHNDEIRTIKPPNYTVCNYDYTHDNGVASDDSDLPEIKFKVGDRIMLETGTGTTGVVEFIGKTNFSKGDVVGYRLKLDGWNPNASNGIGLVNSKEIVNKHIMHKNAWFLQRCSASNFVRPVIREGCYARLTGLEKLAQFNGKAVKVYSFVARQRRWKVKVLMSISNQRKYLGVREGNLDPILDWEPKSFTKEYGNKDYVRCKIEDVNIGVAVQMTNKKWGIVKYIGDNDVLPEWKRKPYINNSNLNYSNNKQIIGLELTKWSPNANNGRVKNVCYFKVNDGFGYFTCINNIINIETSYILWKQERIIWIAFDKNMQNLKCLIVKLPKDLIKYILTLVGHRIK